MIIEFIKFIDKYYFIVVIINILYALMLICERLGFIRLN